MLNVSSPITKWLQNSGISLTSLLNSLYLGGDNDLCRVFKHSENGADFYFYIGRNSLFLNIFHNNYAYQQLTNRSAALHLPYYKIPETIISAIGRNSLELHKIVGLDNDLDCIRMTKIQSVENRPRYAYFKLSFEYKRMSFPFGPSQLKNRQILTQYSEF